MTENLEITLEDYKELKKLYEDHKDKPDSIFIFKGHEIVTSYAKYMIEYIENTMTESANGNEQ